MERCKGSVKLVFHHDFRIPELGLTAPCGSVTLPTTRAGSTPGQAMTRLALLLVRFAAGDRPWGRGARPTPGSCRSSLAAVASNSLRVGLWKIERQALAGALGTEITVCHLPSDTRKWNKIKHWLVSLITQNWRRKPSDCHPTITLLIGATTIKAGLIIKSKLGTAERGQCPARRRHRLDFAPRMALHLTCQTASRPFWW